MLKSKKSAALAGPFLILWGLLFIGSGGFVIWSDLSFRNEGVTTTATVESKSYRAATNEDPASYSVRYAFVDERGQAYRGSTTMSRDSWNALDEGDPMTIQYVRSDPGRNRLPQTVTGSGFVIGPLMILLGGGAAVGGVIITRRRVRFGTMTETSTETPVGDPTMLPGDRLADDPDRRTYGFKRPTSRIVIDLVATPIAAVLFLGFGYLLITGRLTEELGGRAAGLIAGLFGVLLALGALTAFGRGLRRTIVEVGPAGFSTPEAGLIPWSEIAEVRLEVQRMPAGSQYHTGTISYGRIGIVPTDPERQRGSGPFRWAMALSRWMAMVSKRLNPRSSVTTDGAPYGLYAYEVEGGLGPIIQRIRAFVPVVDRSPRTEIRRALAAELAGSPELTPAPALASASQPLATADVRALDALLTPGAVRPTPIVEPTTNVAAGVSQTFVAAEPRVAVRRTYGRPSGLGTERPFGMVSDLVSAGRNLFFIVLLAIAIISLMTNVRGVSPIFLLILGALFAPVAAWAVLSIADLPRRLGQVFNSSDQTLSVGPEGIWLPEMEQLAWSDVAEVKVEQISAWSSDDDSSSSTEDRWRISVLPRDGRLLTERPWSVRQMDRYRGAIGRTVPFLRSWTKPTGFSVTSDQIDAPMAEVVDLISVYHPIVGDVEG